MTKPGPCIYCNERAHVLINNQIAHIECDEQHKYNTKVTKINRIGQCVSCKSKCNTMINNQIIHLRCWDNIHTTYENIETDELVHVTAAQMFMASQ